MNNLIKKQTIMFIVMVIVGMLFNPMNMLAYNIEHLYFSTTLFYGWLLMASNMMWSHEIVHYLSMGHFNKKVFILGLFLSCFCVFLLRQQINVSPNQWLKRMIPHHSTALTTTNKLIKNNKTKQDTKLFRLAKDIIDTQKREILFMKNMLK